MPPVSSTWMRRRYPVGFGHGRGMDDFEKFFNEMDMEYLSDVEAVAMDMNASYNNLVEKHMPYAEIVYDCGIICRHNSAKMFWV